METATVVVGDELAVVAGVYVVIVLEGATAEQPWPLSLE